MVCSCGPIPYESQRLEYCIVPNIFVYWIPVHFPAGKRDAWGHWPSLLRQSWIGKDMLCWKQVILHSSFFFVMNKEGGLHNYDFHYNNCTFIFIIFLFGLFSRKFIILKSYHTIPYHSIPYHNIPSHTIPHHTIPYLTILYLTIP